MYYLKESIILTKREVLGILVTSNVIDGVHHLWFIPYILFCYFLTPYLYDIKEYLKSKSKKGFITGVIFVLFIIIIFSYFFKFYFIPEWICCYVIGFFMIDIISLLDYNEKNIFVNYLL